MRTQRGTTLLDAMLALFLMSMAAVIFTACFPSGISALRQGGETRRAVEITRRKLEQVRNLPFESLTYDNLRIRGAVDTSPTTSPYSFTSVDSLSESLAGATGTMTITSVTGTQYVKQIQVTVNWEIDGTAHTVSLKTYVSDKRPGWGS